jgi:hypothetical protein
VCRPDPKALSDLPVPDIATPRSPRSELAARMSSRTSRSRRTAAPRAFSPTVPVTQRVAIYRCCPLPTASPSGVRGWALPPAPGDVGSAGECVGLGRLRQRPVPCPGQRGGRACPRRDRSEHQQRKTGSGAAGKGAQLEPGRAGCHRWVMRHATHVLPLGRLALERLATGVHRNYADADARGRRGRPSDHRRFKLDMPGRLKNWVARAPLTVTSLRGSPTTIGVTLTWLGSGLTPCGALSARRPADMLT